MLLMNLSSIVHGWWKLWLTSLGFGKRSEAELMQEEHFSAMFVDELEDEWPVEH